MSSWLGRDYKLIVNNIPISEYNAMLQQDYSVSGAEISSSYADNGRSLVLLGQKIGLKTLTVKLTFFGKTSDEAYTRYSMFCASLLGVLELIMPDEKRYRCILTSVGAETYVTEGVMDATFSFIGYKHGALQTVIGSRLFCESTLPKTDCILTATVGSSGENYRLGTVTFPSVTAGEVLKVDGVTKRILVNGVPAAQRAEWLQFPYLVPGINNIDCKDSVTTEYYPAYF